MNDVSYHEFAPAKINLALHIIGKKHDMHLLDSLVAFTTIGDNLSAKISNVDSLKIIGPFASSLKDSQNNLVLKAIKLFREKYPNSLPKGLCFVLEKNLPIASGIGGGSADCAATLRILAKFSKHDISNNDLQKLARVLGADVSACLFSKVLKMQGFGERITIIDPLPSAYILLANPLIQVSTKQVFESLKQVDNGILPEIKQAFSNVEQLTNYLANTRNDLEYPAIKNAVIIKILSDYVGNISGCNFARMTGSGASIFGLFSDEKKAKMAMKSIQDKWPNFWVVQGKIL
ncbi:MAG: 4-(cytidine 5'-diphospho)-2-C-methyl-D-erythritol kinase [Devosiaceae bacterium]|nr:4-(cytidine 5'-diphospho)-2-C-methyl-D-erythritol kinase [Devosiaceae bacterium]